MHIVGAGSSLLTDVEFAYVAGLAAIDAVELEARPIVMHEIARLNGIQIVTNHPDAGVTLILPGLD